MKSQRLNEMEQYIIDQETVSMEELCVRFDVSMNTVRRDIALLLKKGTVEKVYGGVRIRNVYPLLPSFEARTISRTAEKKRIGQCAAQWVMQNDIIFVDSGTTTMHMIEALGDKSATIVTHSLQAINAAVPLNQLNTLVLPGTLQRRTNSFTGSQAVELLAGYHIRCAFMAATGVSIHGVTNSSPLEYEIKRTAMQRSEKKILLIDGRKFGPTALLTYAQIQEFDCIITDVPPPPEYMEVLEASNTQLIIAP